MRRSGSSSNPSRPEPLPPVAKRPRLISPERRRFERATLARLAEAGAPPALLTRARWLLTRGRACGAADRVAVLNRRAEERAGIEALLRELRGDPADFIIIRLHPEPPPVSFHG